MTIKSKKPTKVVKAVDTATVQEATATTAVVIDDSELVDTSVVNDDTVSIAPDSPYSRLISTLDELFIVQAEIKTSQAKERRLLIEARRHSTRVGKDLSRLQKKFARRKDKSKNSASGIMKLQPFHPDSLIVQFMAKVGYVSEKEYSYSRVDCLRAINAYIKELNIQDPDHKEYINIDSTLETLFPELKGKTGTDRLRYRSIMTHLGPHFKSPIPQETGETGETSEVSEGA